MAPVESACIPPSGRAPFAGPAGGDGGALLPNLLKLARALRSVGINVNAAQLTDVGAALALVGLDRRTDVYHAARCVLAHTQEEEAQVDHALDLFFRLASAELVEAERLASAPNDDAPSPRDDRRPRRELGPAWNPVKSLIGGAIQRATAETEKRAGCCRGAWKHGHGAPAWVEPCGALPRIERELLDLWHTINAAGLRGELVSLAWRRRKSKPTTCVIATSAAQWSAIHGSSCTSSLLAHGPRL
jgi:hypothetical protein